MSSFLGIPSPLSTAGSSGPTPGQIDEFRPNCDVDSGNSDLRPNCGVDSGNSDLRPHSSDSTPSVHRNSSDEISPSVDSAVDMTSPINSLEKTSEPTLIHRLSSQSFSTPQSSPSQTFLPPSDSRSVSFINDFRDSFDGEPDIPELNLEGSIRIELISEKPSFQ